MAPMAPLPAPAPAGPSRRAFLAASAGLALLAAGCTAGAPVVTREEADRLAGQVAVQEAVVAAYAVATTADPALALSDLSAQASEQLDRLRAAAPSATSAPVTASPAPPAGADVRTWLRGQLATAAGSHAQACTRQSGARAALLGSIAAGLRGHEAALA
jgi:hypothetical protein